MYGGYGSICKRDMHRPGSKLYYKLKDAFGDSRVENTLGDTRFYPSPPLTSLSYRFDGVNEKPPNTYAEYNASCSDLYVPKYNEGQRKQGAQGCTSCTSPSRREGRLDPILDPKFNLREVAKQMILLEDHLFQASRRCDDCINKHRLTLEAFLEEAITLDKTGEHYHSINSTLKSFKEIMNVFVNKVRRNPVSDIDKVYFETAQKLRLLRKPLCMQYCDFC